MNRHYWFRWWPGYGHRAGAKSRPVVRACRRFDCPLRFEELESRRLLSGTDAFRSAIPIALTGGQPQTGLISQTPTYYDFIVTDSGRLTAEVAPSGGATRLTLLDATGQVLAQSDGQSATNRHDLIDMAMGSWMASSATSPRGSSS